MWVHQVVLTSTANSGNHLTRERLQWGNDGQIKSEKHIHSQHIYIYILHACRIAQNNTISYLNIAQTYIQHVFLMILLKWLQCLSDLTPQIKTNP